MLLLGGAGYRVRNGPPTQPNLPFTAPWADVLVATLAYSLLVTAWVLLAIFGVLSASLHSHSRSGHLRWHAFLDDARGH